MKEVLGSLPEVITAYKNYNLLVPTATDVQLNPFYKFHVEEVPVDLGENSGDIFKVGSVKTGKQDERGKDIWEDVFSLSKPLLNKMAMAAGIQFNPKETYGERIDRVTYRAQAQGAMRKADGTARTETDQKVICLEDEEEKYRIEFADKAAKGITDEKQAQAAAEIFSGQWVESKNKWGKKCQAFVVAKEDRDRYKIKEQIEKYYIKHPDEFGSEREQSLLWLNRNKINKYDELPKTNARLEALKEKAFTGGAEKYLWIPPSLPYYEMQGAYKNSKGFSKILVFSAWEMVPRMIGALVSYEAERLTVGKLVHQIKNQDKKNTGYFAEGSRRYPVARLRFNVSNGEVRGMSLFALLYPSKTLSDMYLPIESLNNHESLEVIEKSVRLKLKEKLAIIEEKYGDSGNNKEDARWYYLAPMLMDGVIYAKHWIEDIVWEMNTDEEDTTFEVRSSSKDKRNKGFIAHIDKLRNYLDAPEEIHLGRKPEDLLETLVNMVLGSPAICIYRSNGRSTARATSLAKVFVNNFNLPESTAIIDLAYGRCRDDNSHWQNVLKYCKDGCFQAMIDEYIHMLKETAGFQSDGNQYQIVHDMMMDSLKIHTATYIADTYPDFKKRINGADRKSDGCRIRSSYAVGFTKDAGDNSKVVMRKENIRNAFNSPMRPFVLATTSIGQEGLDFHNYCRVIMHWNLPSNPIDLEQREGRINRFKCLAIRQNVADKYGKADGITFKRDIWTEMFEAAKAEKQNDQSELVPFWCFGKNQSVKIERLVPMYPMSKDEVNYERLIKVLSLYRLTLGQARQEELLEYLFKEFKDTNGLKKLFIDLSPFSKGKEG